MIRRNVILAAAVVAVLSGTAGMRLNAEEPSHRPNVILIHVDDLDFDEVAAYAGEGLVHSPHMDRLINGGLKFTRAYVNSPVCVPSRYGTLTGRYASRADALADRDPDRSLSHENINNRIVSAATIQDSEYTLARMMASAGYTTGLIGKYHNDAVFADPPIQHIKGDPSDPAVAQQIRQNYDQILERVQQDTGFDVVDRLYYCNKEQFVPASKDLQVNNTPWITEGAIKFIRQNREQPFFLYYSNPIPHGRVHPQSVTRNAGRRKKPRKPPRGSRNYRLNMVERSALATPAGFLETVPTVQPPREDAIARAQEHAPDGFPNNALITWLDDSIGALLQELEDQGLLDDTLIVFQSDHQSVGKFTVYDRGARIPMAVYWKGRIPAGSVSDRLVSNVDIFATLADVCGADIPSDRTIDGVSLKPLFQNPQTAARDSLLVELGFARAVVTERWKYIALRFPEGVEAATAENPVQVSGLSRPQKQKQLALFPHYADADQLYDLSQDPEEQTNLFAAPQHHHVGQELQQLLGKTLATFPHDFGEFR